MMTRVVISELKRVQLPNVHCTENLQRNIISYGLLKGKEYGIAYNGSQRGVAGINGGPTVLNVEAMDNILAVRVQDFGKARRSDGVLMVVLSQREIEPTQDVQPVSLMLFHGSLGHLHYDTIILMAKDPASGIQLTEKVGSNCFACSQGKQAKNKKSTRDTGKNASIDGIEESYALIRKER
uniref:Uncharacterized protein AlNc14C91G5711 n=1 Tax=Albugo laibachii Nc14 TaxID=890382 RepID=F0WGH8_9STRA|nr:hypothetical protein PITG_16835 [Albugo laibachii Nc14]|eukprot:CCA20341.1 hypothetical protein PITG_16835 [Albugo laibachii Nc14]